MSSAKRDPDVVVTHLPRVSKSTVTIAKVQDLSDWRNYLSTAKVDGHFFAWEWRHILHEALGHRPVYLIARRAGAVSGILPLFEVRSRLFGRALISVPFLNGGGVVADDASSAKVLLQRASAMVGQTKAAYGELRQRTLMATPDGLERRSHKVAMRLKLNDDPGRMLDGLTEELKSRIKAAGDEGAKVEFSPGDHVSKRELDGYYKLFSEYMRDQGTPVLPKYLFEETLRSFGSNASLVTIQVNGQTAAGALLIGLNGSLEMLWASASPRIATASASVLLHWESLRHAAVTGYEIFDFGRCTPDSPSFKFKALWGATPTKLDWYYLPGRGRVADISLDNPSFQVAIKVWKKLPLPVANRLGPLIAPSLP